VSFVFIDSTKNAVTRICPSCGYDLRAHAADNANAAIKCPECGSDAPPLIEREFVEPRLLWHLSLGLSFGLPLILTAFEAAKEMICHAGGATAWAPGWLILVIFLGGISMLACFFHALLRTRYRGRLIGCGIVFVVLYLLALIYMSQWIEWHPYKN
jgi:predicted RNA-binding Zn-ribbon protein involved in translation (DUF1610 family)